MLKKKWAVPASVGVAAVWFGSHAGAGFATGRQEVEFFVRFGWHAVWIGMLSMAVMGTAIYFGLELARVHGVSDYRSLFNKLYSPLDKIFANLWDALYLYATLLGTAVAIAGASHLIHQSLPVPYGLAVVLVGAILLIFTIFGSGLVRSASTAMALFIITALLIVAVLGIKSGAANLAAVVRDGVTRSGFADVLWMALLYGAFQSVIIAPVVSVSDALKTRRDSLKAAVIGALVNGSMLVLVCVMLLGFFPAVIEEHLPVYFVTSKLGRQWLFVLYSLILFIALISTGVGLIFGVVKRFEAAWTKGRGIFQSLKVRRITVCVSCLLIAAGISLFGLTAIVAKGYGSLGILAIFLNIIPLLFIAPFKIARARGAEEGES
jgi:uncharacterized membrane protein YkvI